MIYDCFPFFNELDLLEIRLEELSEVVDRFVIVESPVTYSGKDKPLHFQENSKRFLKWYDKITPVVLSNPIMGENKVWERDHQQRNYIAEVLLTLCGVKDDDLILLSDADEIPSASCFPDIDFVTARFTGGKRPAHLNQRTYLYYFNFRFRIDMESAVAFPAALLHSLTPQALRESTLLKHEIVPDAGWHFTYMGGREKVLLKRESWAHCNDAGNKEFLERLRDENFRPEEIDPAAVREVLIDSTYPKHVYRNQALWCKRGYLK